MRNVHDGAPGWLAMVMPKVERSIRLFLCAALLILAGGCAASTPASPHAGRMVVLWHTFAGEDAETLRMLTDRFNESNTWGIVLVTEYQERILERLPLIEPQNRPDLVVIWPQDLPDYVSQGLIGARPTEVVAISRNLQDLLPMASALYSFEGNLQALPLGLATYIAYYSSGWLGDLGYQADQATWAELRSTACAATNPLTGHTGLGIPARSGVLMALLTASGAQIIDQQGMFSFSDPAGIAVADILHEILTGSCGVVYEDFEAGLDELSKSATAIVIESSERYAAIEEAVAEAGTLSLGVTALPGLTGKGATLWYGPGMAVLSVDPEQRDAALATLGWFYSVDAQMGWTSATNYLSVRRSLLVTQLSNTSSPSRRQLYHVAIDAANDGTWAAWPPYAEQRACRASLLRALLALSEADRDPGAYLGTAVTACNTGVRFESGSGGATP